MTEILGIAPERIDVIPCACPEHIQRVSDPAALDAIQKKYLLSAPYLLFVGNFNPRKNLERLIRAFDLVKRRCSFPHELIIAGGQGWKFDASQALEGIASRDSVRFIGYVPDEEMSALYSGAEIFLFPTLYEGFGIPVLEAQRCGTAVLTSGVSALPEVGGDAAYYIDPLDTESIAHGIETLLREKELRAALIEKGFANEMRYSWNTSAQKLHAIVEERTQ